MVLTISTPTIIPPVPNGLGVYRYQARAYDVTGTLDLTSPEVVTAEPVQADGQHGIVFLDDVGHPIRYWLRDDPVTVDGGTHLPTYAGNTIYGHSYAVGDVATYQNGFPDALDTLMGGYSAVADSFGRSDTPSEVDSFTRADSAVTLGTTETTGKAWTAYAGTWGIASNQGRVVTGSGGKNVAAFDTGVSDGAWTVTWASGAGTGIGMVVRLVDGSNYLYMKRSGASALQLRKVVAGVDTQIGADMAAIVAAGVVLTIVMNGSTISVLFASAAGVVPLRLASFSDSTFQTATSVGLYNDAAAPTGTRYDDASFAYQETRATPIGGAVPVQLVGCWAVRSNVLSLVASNGVNNLIGWDAGWSDGMIEFAIGTYSEAMGLAFRIQDAANFLFISVSSITGAWVLKKCVANVVTQISSGVLGGSLAGQVVRIYFLGTRIRITSNAMGSDVISNPSDWTVTEFATATRHGLYAPTPVTLPMTWDDFYLTKIRQQALGGSQVSPHSSTGSYVEVLQNTPRLAATELAVITTGLNDMTLVNGKPRGALAFLQSLRATVGRFLARTVFEDTDASVVYGGVWSTTAATDKNSGAGYHECSAAAGRTITITVPASYMGETIQLGFITVHDDGGGTATISIDGTASVPVTTNGVWTGNSFYGAHVIRLGPLAPGPHVITVTVLNVTGAFIFDYWAIEHDLSTAPRVLLCNVARITNYGTYGLTTLAGDAAVAVLNVQISQIVAEYAGKVRLVDIDGALAQNPANFYSDGVHPKTTGHALIAVAMQTVAIAA